MTRTAANSYLQKTRLRHDGGNPARAPRNFDTRRRLPGAINLGMVDGHCEPMKLENLWQLCRHLNWRPPSPRPQWMKQEWKQVAALAIGAMIGLASGAMPLPAQPQSPTNAFGPYNRLDDIFQPISAVDPAKLQIHVFISSTNKSVHPSDIRLTIHSATQGLIPVPVKTNGQIVNFPDTKELRRENPAIIANQPKGSLYLFFTIQIPPSDDLTFPYRRLGDSVAEMNKSIRAQAGWALSLLAPKVQGVIFLFPRSSAGKATVEIDSAAGRKQYTADKHGVIKLKLANPLLAENPQVKMSQRPDHIVPDMWDMK